MLQTYSLADTSFRSGFGTLGAMSSPAILELQNYLKGIGKYGKTPTGVIDDATVSAIYELLIASAEIVGKISALPAEVRGPINAVVTTLKDADSKVRGLSAGLVTLPFLLAHWLDAQAIARQVSESAANAMLQARDAVYNAVGAQAGTIKKALSIFFPAKTGRPSMEIPPSKLVKFPTFTTESGTVPSSAVIYAYSPKKGMYRVAMSRGVTSTPPFQEIAPSATAPAGAGFGGIGIMDDHQCVFGNCGLGAAQEVTEPEFEKLTRAPFYKRPLFWAAVAGGVAVVGGGSYYLVRRRRTRSA